MHGRASLADYIARFGSLAVARAALPLMAPLQGGREPLRPGGIYRGPNLDAFAHWTGYQALRARLGAAPSPLAAAVERNNLALMAAVIAARPQDIVAQTERAIEPLGSMASNNFEEQTGRERFEDAPPEPQRTIALMLIRAAAQQSDPQHLERALQATVGYGWDELSRAILSAGFDARRARRPDRLWSRWSNLGAPCRPSTGELLVKAGLPVGYPLDPVLNGRPAMWIVAVACGNPASARVLAAAAPAQLGYIEEDGSTLVDLTEQRRRPRMTAALRALGVRRGAELTGKAAAERSALRRAVDWDIVQSADVR